MLLQEVVLCTTAPSASSTGTGLIALHDLQTGTPLASFKQTSPAPHCTAHIATQDGQGGVILAAQADKALLNVFSFRKDQVLAKNVLPEKLCCVAVDPRGAYCAGGTASGRLYLWELASGILFNSFEAHYRRLSVLRFTHDGAALVSGSDDSSVHVWSLARLLDEDTQADIPTPYCSFAEHTLPVTDILCGVGAFPAGRVLTASLDHSVKLHDLATRTLLTSFLFPHPIAVLALDPAERAFFAAAAHSGALHHVHLFRRRPGARAAEARGGGGMADVVRLADDDDTARLISAPHPITSLALSLSAALLLAGTAAGHILVYDAASHQLLRAITTYKDKGLAITSVAALLRPPDLLAATEPAAPVRALAPLQRTRDAAARARHEVPMLLPITSPDPTHTPAPFRAALLAEHRYFVEPTTTTTTTAPSRLAELESEVARLREQLGSAKGLNDAMWEGVVQRVLRDGDGDGDGSGEGEPRRKRSRVVT